MKKITLFLFLLSISLSFGQVILDENFDDGPFHTNRLV